MPSSQLCLRYLGAILACLSSLRCAPELPARTAVQPQELPRGFFTNPLNLADWPDPGVIAVKNPEAHQAIYYLVATSGSFPIQRSDDLIHWQATGAAVMPTGKAPWAADGNRNWAPEIHRLGNSYVAYYTASAPIGQAQRYDPLAIGAAWSDSILGPYQHLPQPLIPAGAFGSIDPTVFSENGRVYLYWKTDGNCCGVSTQIIMQELEADGLALKAGSRPSVVLSSDLPWEENLIEGPWLIRRGPWIYLFYSAARFNANYRNGVARSLSPRGPFVKLEQPFLVGNATYRAPGHGSVLALDEPSRYVYLHHAYYQRGIRSLMLTPLSWNNDWPEVAGQVPPSGPLSKDVNQTE